MQKTLLQKMDVLINLLSNQQEKESIPDATYETNILPNFPLPTTKEFTQFNEDLEKYEDLKIIFVSIIVKTILLNTYVLTSLFQDHKLALTHDYFSLTLNKFVFLIILNIQ